MAWRGAGGGMCHPRGSPPPRPGRPPPHPLLVQLEELLGDLGGAEGQAQAVDVELRDDVFQGVLQREPPHRPVLGGGGGGVLQDGAPQGDKLGKKLVVVVGGEPSAKRP